MQRLLEHIPTRMKRVSSTCGGEYHGPCPWCGGTDRFRVQPGNGESGFFKCRQCEMSGDGIQFLRDYHKLSFQEACELLGLYHKLDGTAPSAQADPAPDLLRAPGATWQQRARRLAEEAQERLYAKEGRRALDWLRSRGLSDEALLAASIGYHPEDCYEPASRWGLDRNKDVWLPRGITIPWVVGGAIWRLNIRRPKGDPRYYAPPGSANALYLADRVKMNRPCVLVEGELDAWSVLQAAHDLTAAAAVSTSGGRRMRWMARLSLASVVLVAFDSDEPGEKAAPYWTDRLPNAVRWRPYWGDVNDMLRDGADVRAWVQAGLNLEPSQAIAT